jgi:hypothetical protein
MLWLAGRPSSFDRDKARRRAYSLRALAAEMGIPLWTICDRVLP